MRSVGVAGFAVILGALVALRALGVFQGSSTTAEIPGLSEVAAELPEQVAPEPASTDEPDVAERPEVAAPTTQEGIRSSDRDRWRYRRWLPNRYPGPIPTPADWKPPPGPVRIALQAGHWRANEAPRELSGLRRNGTSWQGLAEWEVNLEIARAAGAMLEEMGYVIEILPAVVPPSYRAHLFISIHADGSADPRASGFRVAPPRRDATGRASDIAARLRESYGNATGIGQLPTITRRMRNYYAFNFRRYEHALHPMTIGVIIETGFLTSSKDREVIVDRPELAAQGIVDAVASFPVTPPPRVADNPDFGSERNSGG